MRRKDREVTDYSKMLEMVSGCDCCRLGLIDDEGAYMVPLNFGWEDDNGKLILYFHGAPEGKKIDLIKKQSTASFEMDCKHELVENAVGCSYTFNFLSVMGHGKISFITELEDKYHAFRQIFKSYTDKEEDLPMMEKAVAATAVIKMEVTDWSAKEHQ